MNAQKYNFLLNIEQKNPNNLEKLLGFYYLQFVLFNIWRYFTKDFVHRADWYLLPIGGTEIAILYARLPGNGWLPR